jgi:hypothetical protein
VSWVDGISIDCRRMRNRVGWTLRQGEIGCSAFLVWHFSGVRAQRRVLFYLRGFRYDIKQICSRSHTYPSFSYVLFTTGNCPPISLHLCNTKVGEEGEKEAELARPTVP